MTSAAFEYTDEQWQVIVAAADPNGHLLDREEMEERARLYLFHHNRVTDRKRLVRLAAEIKALEIAQEILGDDPLGELLGRRIGLRRRNLDILKSVPSARQRNACPEALIVETLTDWFKLTGERPGRSTKEGARQDYGPSVRFAQSVVSPAFGTIQGNAVGTVIRKMRVEGVLQKIDAVE